MNDDKIDLVTRIVERTGKSLFLTGKAGTGKTTFLHNLRSTSRKRMVVAAPTGIAAINAGGVTLHSFFQLDFGPFVPGSSKSSGSRRHHAFSKEKVRIIRGMDLLVIDEISMVRADVLDAVDAVLRRFRDRTLPFGGVQLLLIGDLQQLPPVVVDSEREILQQHYSSPYFFDSHALQQLDYLTVELTKVYRQDDEKFIGLLNAVRDNKADENILKQLNSRHIPQFKPTGGEGYVRLTTHNRFADEINNLQLDSLQGEPHVFEAKIEGKFPESSYPADPNLVLKVGAQVMFIKNDSGSDRKFYNGMLGTVTAIDEDGVSVLPADGAFPIPVEPVAWENLKFVVNEETNEITEEKEGVFSQLPLKLAWAITIHKSQGLTFDKAMIDASMSFSHGQTYVALSRCRSLEGLVLERPLSRSAIITDPTVTNFIRKHNSVDSLDAESVNSLSHAYFIHLILEMFNFRPIFSMLEGVVRLLKENFMKIFPEQVTKLSNRIEEMRISIQDVSTKFHGQLVAIDEKGNHAENNELLLKRIKDASAYFLNQLRELSDIIASLPTDHDNRNVQQKLDDRIEMVSDAVTIKQTLLDNFSNDDFTLERYLDIKAKGAFQAISKKRKRARGEMEIKSQYSNDNIHPELFDSLCVWRRKKADEISAPAFVVASTKTLLAVANYTPRTYEDLIMLPGIGPAMVKKYGDDLLSLVDAYIESSDPETLEILPIPIPKKRKRKL